MGPAWRPMLGRLGVLLLVTQVGAGRPRIAHAQELTYSGSLSYATGSYAFTERSHSFGLSSGLRLSLERVSVSASIPLVVQNSGVVSYVAGQPLPTGGESHGALTRRSGDTPIGTRRGGGRGSGPVMDSATVVFRSAYELQVADPLLRGAYEVYRGFGTLRSLELYGSAKAPLRGLDSGVGTGAWDVGAGAAFAFDVRPVWLFLDVAYWSFGDLPELELEDGLLYSVGLSRPLLDARASVLLSLSGATSTLPGLEAPLHIALGLSFLSASGRSWFLGVGAGLSESSADASAFVGWSVPLAG